jgi:hypothetical protein
MHFHLLQELPVTEYLRLVESHIEPRETDQVGNAYSSGLLLLLPSQQRQTQGSLSAIDCLQRSVIVYRDVPRGSPTLDTHQQQKQKQCSSSMIVQISAKLW